MKEQGNKGTTCGGGAHWATFKSVTSRVWHGSWLAAHKFACGGRCMHDTPFVFLMSTYDCFDTIVEALWRSNGDDGCKWHVDRIMADDPLRTVFGNLKTLPGFPYVDLRPALVRCIPLTLLALGSGRLGAKQPLYISLYASNYSPRWFELHSVDRPGYAQAHHGWLFHDPRT